MATTLLSSLHIHPTSLTANADDCTECVNHHCGGHIGQRTLTLHDCVLCQFLTLPVAVAAAVVVVLYATPGVPGRATSRHHAVRRACGTIVTRGPPAR